MPKLYLEAVCREGQGVNPLFAFLEARLTLARDGRAEITMPTGMHLCQGGGMVAGGILATLADEAMAHAVMSVLEPGQSTVTAEMNIRYLHAADPKQGGLLIAKAELIKKGRSLCATEAGVFDQTGRHLAQAGATFYVLGGKNPA